MFKRKRENKRCNLLEIVGFLLILLSISLLAYKVFTSMNYQMEELILIEDFYDRYGDKSMTPIIEDEIIEEEQEEVKQEIISASFISGVMVLTSQTGSSTKTISYLP